MFETYRMLGAQREAELLREARRLHAGRSVKDGGVLRLSGRRFVSVFRSNGIVLLVRLRVLTARAAEKPPRSQLDP